MTQAFPLQWPHHVPRTLPHNRAWGGFQVTPERATQDLLKEVQRSGGKNLVISTNRPLRRDGLPMQSGSEPIDPGVAVYFTRKGKSICIPCDSFDRVWKNIRAISLSIADMRGPESRGCAAITDQAFTGFTALPAPDQATEAPHRAWWLVLGLASRPRTTGEIDKAWKAACREAGGATTELNAARDEGLSQMKEQANG